MPFYGTLDIDAALAGAPTMVDLQPETWALPGASVLQVSYEVENDPALAATPPSCHPSIPPYATFSVLQFPESPHGPFNLAMVRLIVRAGIRPRGFLLGAVVDNEAAAKGLAAGWGYRVRTGEVSYSRRYETIRGTVDIDGSTALDISLRDPEPVVGGDLELFDNLHLANLGDEGGVIVQVDPTYEYRSADRGRAEIDAFDADALGINGIIPNYDVVAVSCQADLELAAPRFVMDPSAPAVKGTRRL